MLLSPRACSAYTMARLSCSTAGAGALLLPTCPKNRCKHFYYIQGRPILFPIPATRPPGLSSGGSLRSIRLIIRYSASLHKLFRRLLKTAAILLRLDQMAFTIHHLKNLGTIGLQYLTHLFKLSINHCNIPAIWKRNYNPCCQTLYTS